MDGGALTGSLVVIVAGGLTAALVALMLGVIWLFRVGPHVGRWSPRRKRTAPSTPVATDRAQRLSDDVEGVIDLVRGDRLRATGRADIEALTLAETLLERAVARYRGDELRAQAPSFVPPRPPREVPPAHLAPSVRNSSGAAATPGAG